MDSPLPALFHPRPSPHLRGLGNAARVGGRECQRPSVQLAPVFPSGIHILGYTFCSKAMETQGSPLPCVCAGKGEGGVQGTEGTPDIGLTSDYPQTKRPPSFLRAFTTGLAHLPPPPRKDGVEVAAAKAAGNRVGGKATRRGRIERPTMVMRSGR